MTRQEPFGARLRDDGVSFAVWSDKARRVIVKWRDARAGTTGELALVPRAGQDPHRLVGFQPGLSAGARYDLTIDGVQAVDPYARSLPLGVHGPAEVVAPLLPKQHAKRRVDLSAGEVFYEIHVGTFTPEGSFAQAAERLTWLERLGVTVIELMPIAAFPGKRGWGYDGVGLFAPFAGYGTLQDLSSFIDAAHGSRMSVVLDVVYNHLGPDGNYLSLFSEAYFDSGRSNPWGTAPAFEKSAFRRFVVDNTRYWLEEVGFDGLRLDATHELEPGGDPHILQEISAVARGCTPPATLVAEDDRNDPDSLFSHGVDAVWSDDFHHCVHVLLTAERDGYYEAYRGNLQELARVIERGQLYEGQVFPITGQPRGRPAAHLPRERLIYALQNHDQVGNRACGERLHALCGVERFRAATVLLLFLPATPLLFMGQEFAESAPFLYFTDHHGELGAAVTRGRCQEFAKFSGFSDAVPDPQAEETFRRSKLTWSVTDEAARTTLELHRAALELRRTDPVLSARRSVHAGVQNDVLWVSSSNHAGQRLLLLNTGPALSEARLAEHEASQARLLLSTSAATHDERCFHLASGSCSVFAISTAAQTEIPNRD